MSADRLRGAVILWWAPSLAAARLRFAAEMAVVDLLFLLGRDRSARRALAGIVLRNKRALRAAREHQRAPERAMQGRRR